MASDRCSYRVLSVRSRRRPRQVDASIEIIYDLPEVSASAGTPEQQPTVPVMTDAVASTICGEIVSASQLLLFEQSPKDYYRIYRCGLPAREDQWQRALARLEREEEVVAPLRGRSSTADSNT